MRTPKDITEHLVDWKEKEAEKEVVSAPKRSIGISLSGNTERSLAFDAFSWFVYSALFIFLLVQLGLLVIFDLL